MKEFKSYLVNVYRCPHCNSELDYSSESSNLEKTMENIFALLNTHKSKCNKIKGAKLTNVSIRTRTDSDGSLVSEYKINKILI
jgi:hypothetical protein